MSLTPDQIQRLARLARIALEPAQAGPALEQLNRVLGLIDQLQAVDTTGVEPMSHPLEAVQGLREDAVTETDHHAQFQAIAPAVERDLYLVPKVIE